MTTEERLQHLERELRYLKDRQEILDCIAQNARGCDRQDSELLAGTYHTDGIDEHGRAVNPGPRYPEWANPGHSAMSVHSMHNITTHTCEIEGDIAHSDSYSVGLFLDPNGKTARVLAGRYADRLERRDGKWKIVLRRCTVEIALVGDATFLSSEAFAKMGFLQGLRDKRDVSYQRPLTLDSTPKGHRW